MGNTWLFVSATALISRSGGGGEKVKRVAV
jgi:hypothetical protein